MRRLDEILIVNQANQHPLVLHCILANIFFFFCIMKETDGRGHFKTVLASFKRRALYEDTEKYLNFKAKIYEVFLYLMKVYSSTNPNSKFYR